MYFSDSVLPAQLILAKEAEISILSKFMPALSDEICASALTGWDSAIFFPSTVPSRAVIVALALICFWPPALREVSTLPFNWPDVSCMPSLSPRVLGICDETAAKSQLNVPFKL